MTAGVQQRVFGDGAGSDDAGYRPLDHRLAAPLLGFGGIFHLLADGNLDSLADQPRQIAFMTMHRHAAHGNVIATMLAPLGQGDVQGLGGAHRVVEEHLVKITHPVKQQAIGMRPLDGQILHHHRRGIFHTQRRLFVKLGGCWIRHGLHKAQWGWNDKGRTLSRHLK